MFDADSPIFSYTQDRLGRTVFAKYLARCILDNKNTNSLTVGLFGSWGVGKTSVINLMLEELYFAASNMADDEIPIILNFSAWSYSGQDQLIYHFFRRLSSAIRDAPSFNNKDKIIHLLEWYISFFTEKTVPTKLRTKGSIWSRIFKGKQTGAQGVGWQTGRDLTSIKAELNDLLRQQKHKIIIIIDNIMRLKAREINQMFQIVKSMGNYENTTYVLSLDRDLIIDILNKTHLGQGKNYLEKIIQLPFDIPSISREDLEFLLADRLQLLFALVPEGRWDSHYWSDLYFCAIKYFFQNVRDVTRYINILGFSFDHVKEVVNPMDFFAITAIQVFAPDIYYAIRDNKDLFTDLADQVYEFDEEKLAEDKNRCDEILNRIDEKWKPSLVQLLLRLFPRLRSMYQSSVFFYHSQSIARKNFRICDPDMFDIYFRLSMSTGSIPASEMNALLNLSKDEEGFTLELMRLNHDDKIVKFLDLLDSDGVLKIPVQYIGHVLNALMDTGDLFPEGATTVFSINTEDRIHRLTHQLLRRIDNPEERFNLLNAAILKATNSLYIFIHELNRQSEEHKEESDTYLPLENRDFFPDQLEQLKKSAVTKIAYWAATKRLTDHPKLLTILYAWKAWEEDEACEKFVMEITEDNKGLLAFLQAALKQPIEETILKLEKKDWSSYLANIYHFIEPTLLESRAKALFEDLAFEKLREKEQLAILIFLDLIKAETYKIIPKTSY